MLEYQQASQLLFQQTFNLNFNVNFVQHTHTRASIEIPKLSNDQQTKIKTLNHLDFKLYEEAKRIFFERLLLHGIPVPKL